MSADDAAPLPPEAARVLAASEQQFRLAFDHAPSGMAILSLEPDSAGRYVRVNAAYCTMLGRDDDELIGMSVLDVTHPDDRERDWAILQRIMRGDAETETFEKRFLHKHGHSVFASVVSRVAPNRAGEPLYLLVHAVDVTQRRHQQAELQRLALTDSLTGLANRTLLNDRLDQALARLNRDRSYAALLLIDVDRFKLVNESLGHEVGDALLVEVASRIEAVSRADATVARVGGDEFVVLVEGLTTPAEVHRIGVRLLEVLRKPHILAPSAEPVVATVSIGIAVATTPERSAGEVYREADLALYRAKEAGRNQYALFDDELSANVVARVESENLLRRAIADDLVVAHYQPVIDLASGSIIGVEALARIRDPVRGLVGPSGFIDVAEETGLITEIDVRVLELGVGRLATWRKDADSPLHRLFVNVSARSLDDSRFVERVAAILKWYGVGGDAVCVELTERSLLATNQTVRTSLVLLERMGLQVGLDNFGTGYSAMAYLQQFPLRFLKIDRLFIGRLGHSRRDDAVVASVIDLAHVHDLQVVAEGIETPEQLSAVRAMGCDSAQGFLISRPLDVPALEELARSRRHW